MQDLRVIFHSTAHFVAAKRYSLEEIHFVRHWPNANHGEAKPKHTPPYRNIRCNIVPLHNGVQQSSNRSSRSRYLLIWGCNKMLFLLMSKLQASSTQHCSPWIALVYPLSVACPPRVHKEVPSVADYSTLHPSAPSRGCQRLARSRASRGLDNGRPVYASILLHARLPSERARRIGQSRT